MIGGDKKMNKKKYKIGSLDYIAYACSALVYILPQYLLSSFLSAYYTDVALISAGVVGTIVLVMRFTDGVSDLIMGQIIDRTNTRWGKARPWMIVGSIGLTVTLFAVFHAPSGWSAGAKIAWLAVTYFLVMTIFGTIQGVASSTLIVYMTDDVQKRNKLGASNMAGVYLGGIAATALTAVLLSKFGYTQSGYDKTMVIYGTFVLVFGIFAFAKLRENQKLTNIGEKEKSAPIQKILYSIAHNRYYIFAVLAGLLINLSNGISTGMGIYVCRDVFDQADMYAVLALVMILPTLIGLPVAVMIAKKIGHQKTLMYGRVIFIVCSCLTAYGLLTRSMPLYLAGGMLGALFNSAFAACFTARVANICDYNKYHFDIDASGTLMSATSFCNKIGLGLGAAMTGLILEIARYNGEAANAGIAQSAYTISAESYCVAFIPIIFNIIIAVCLFFSNVDPKMPEVREALERDEKQKVK